MGKLYDKPMIDAAKYAIKGETNKIISMADAKLILKAARPTPDGRSSYGKDEKMTMAYIRSAYKFTPAADKQLRAGIAKLGAAQGKRTRAMKAAKAKKVSAVVETVAAMNAMKAMKAAKAKKTSVVVEPVAAMKAMKAMKAAKAKKTATIVETVAAMKAMKAMKAAKI